MNLSERKLKEKKRIESEQYTDQTVKKIRASVKI